jgi:HAD superfamily phosphoserine phosphatase-like hydrolase
MNLALFDFDGTITSTDTWTPFMRRAVRPSRLRISRVLMMPLVIGYKLGFVSASRGREIAVRLAFRGEDAASVRSCGIQYATETLPRTVRESALERIEWHRSRGDEILIVSAALDVYVKPWAEGFRSSSCPSE